MVTLRLSVDVDTPEAFAEQEYDYVEGWKIIDLSLMNDALGKCFKSIIVLYD